MGIPAHHDARMAWRLIVPLILCTSVRVEPRPVHVWQLDEIATARVLVVGQILATEKDECVHDHSFWWSSSAWAMTAEVRILRSYVTSGKPISVGQLQLHFLACCTEGFTDGPILSGIEPGQVLVLPLREDKSLAWESWQLVPDEGIDMTLPTRAEMENIGPPPSARAFLIREIANTLSRGTPGEVTAVGRYLAEQHENLTPDLMPLMEPAIDADRQRWAEVATGIMATTGVPRPSFSDLFSSMAGAERRWGQKSVFIAQAALRELGASPETENLLIETLIADIPLHAWGSAGVLLEYADNPLTIETLRQALNAELPGSTYVAWTFLRGGHQALLQEGLRRALKVVDQPSTDLTELQGAAALLRDYGSDQQLRLLASLVKKYQTQDRKLYSLLWQWSTESDNNPREARVLAVVLRDRSIAFGESRFCDLAVYELERATGQHFGAGGKTIADRDAAVSRALAWAESH